MIGAILSGLSALGSGIAAASANKRIKKIMGEMKPPSEEPVNIARGALSKAQSMEQGQMPGTEAYNQALRQNQASQIAATERAGGDPIAAAANAAAATNQAQLGLAEKQGQFKMGAAAQTAQMSQGLQNAIMQNEQLRNDYLQSKISGESSRLQNWSNMLGGIGQLGGGLMSNAAYIQGRGGKTNFWDMLKK
jgi:hypothetical protein